MIMGDAVHINASAKDIMQTPRKVGLVAALVRGRSVADALVILEHTPKRAAGPVKKALKSAKANALNNHKLQEQGLRIEHMTVSEGKHLKRYSAGARGQPKPYEKRRSHIFITLSGEPKPAKKPTTKKQASKAEERES